MFTVVDGEESEGLALLEEEGSVEKGSGEQLISEEPVPLQLSLHSLTGNHSLEELIVFKL